MLRILLALAASCNLDILQFDITLAQLHGKLKEDLYVDQPDGYTEPGKEKWVWRLKKGLYRLVQVGRRWNEELNTHMRGIGFSVMDKDHAVFVKGDWNSDMFVAGGFWVDDFIGISSGKELDVLAKGMDAKYRITGLGEVEWVLGMLVKCDHAAWLCPFLQFHLYTLKNTYILICITIV